jgi:hypothetical protein
MEFASRLQLVQRLLLSPDEIVELGVLVTHHGELLSKPAQTAPPIMACSVSCRQCAEYDPALALHERSKLAQIAGGILPKSASLESARP